LQETGTKSCEIVSIARQMIPAICKSHRTEKNHFSCWRSFARAKTLAV